MVCTHRAMRMKWINACLVLGRVKGPLGGLLLSEVPISNSVIPPPHTSCPSVLMRMGAFW